MRYSNGVPKVTRGSWDPIQSPAMNYWSMKSEPGVFGIADLQRQRQAVWDGVRNVRCKLYCAWGNL